MTDLKSHRWAHRIYLPNPNKTNVELSTMLIVNHYRDFYSDVSIGVDLASLEGLDASYKRAKAEMIRLASVRDCETEDVKAIVTFKAEYVCIVLHELLAAYGPDGMPFAHVVRALSNRDMLAGSGCVAPLVRLIEVARDKRSMPLFTVHGEGTKRTVKLVAHMYNPYENHRAIFPKLKPVALSAEQVAKRPRRPPLTPEALAAIEAAQAGKPLMEPKPDPSRNPWEIEDDEDELA